MRRLTTTAAGGLTRTDFSESHFLRQASKADLCAILGYTHECTHGCVHTCVHANTLQSKSTTVHVRHPTCHSVTQQDNQDAVSHKESTPS